ncbi:hypothetical protein BAE44_0019179 [Dichanthelium oligosanthes]|uniref:Calcineurin-like phosphoesterase domain-containing protein n=1 Tax=Dichanthelium oligosanthes TaxID=888268 RepID=A0A1E5V3S8_9POAL|nr:hypothetical protein BAE44_0019179 [Dichanthelium oligosanthes]
MQSATRLTLLLCAAWAVTVLYGEMGAYWASYLACSWPSPSPSSSSLPPNDHVKIAVVADPQLMDSTSLGLPSSSIVLQTAEFYTDLNMRRSFQSSILPLRPDVVLFLGDHFDGGPYMSDEEWQESLFRFKHIFSLNEQRTKPHIPIYYLSGNHDIGYSAFHSVHPEVFSRYKKEFGPRNYQFSAGKVDFVVIDAQTLDGMFLCLHLLITTSLRKSMPLRVSYAALDQGITYVLPHILLFYYFQFCGPPAYLLLCTRIAYVISDVSYFHGSYQNYLTKETSDLLLSSLKPVLVLSGHDHDQCTVVHSTPFGPVTEVKNCSFLSPHIPRFVSNGTCNATAYARDNKYICQFVVTILLLVFWPTNGLSSLPYMNTFVSFMRSVGAELFSRTKEKDDAEDGEYEMVFDAEGSMHLVKKAVARAPSASADSRTLGRYVFFDDSYIYFTRLKHSLYNFSMPLQWKCCLKGNSGKTPIGA